MQNDNIKGANQDLAPDLQEELLRIAQISIEEAVKNKKAVEFKTDHPALLEKKGAFVTLTKKGNLRGCIGYIEAVKPLYITVRDAAISAALQDPRFNKVTPEELEDLEMEISVLSPKWIVKDINEIQVGVHGLIIEKGSYRGLLLPQVALDYRWSKEEFLEHTCQKAGLYPLAWKEKDTKIYCFSAFVFGKRGRKV